MESSSTYVNSTSSSEKATDLASRWKRARLSALKGVTAVECDDEAQLLTLALEMNPAQTLRQVFDNSSRLGAGFRRFFGLRHSLATLPDLLSQLGVPCLAGGTWHDVEGGKSFSRPPCAMKKTEGECDYWREAIDGLVIGLTEEVRHTRHKSLGHGDQACLDMLYDDPTSNARFGPLPEEVVHAAEPLQRLLKRVSSDLKLTMLGVSEGVLLYRLEAKDGCSTVSLARQLIERNLSQKVPHLTLRELSPKSVFEGAH